MHLCIHECLYERVYREVVYTIAKRHAQWRRKAWSVTLRSIDPFNTLGRVLLPVLYNRVAAERR